MINPDWQDAVLIYKDSEGNKQEQYFYATANNQKSWVENFDDYSNHDYHNAAQSDADFAEKAGPLAKGLALLVSPISLYNSGKTLATGEDIYGNKADNLDKLLSVADLVSFGLSKIIPYKQLRNMLSGINNLTTAGSSAKTLVTELEK